MGQRDTILIVDDMEVNRVILSGLFQEEYHLLEAEERRTGPSAPRSSITAISNHAAGCGNACYGWISGNEGDGGSGLLDEVPVVVITADNSLEGNCVPLTWAPRTSL